MLFEVTGESHQDHHSITLRLEAIDATDAAHKALRQGIHAKSVKAMSADAEQPAPEDTAFADLGPIHRLSVTITIVAAILTVLLGGLAIALASAALAQSPHRADASARLASMLLLTHVLPGVAYLLY